MRMKGFVSKFIIVLIAASVLISAISVFYIFRFKNTKGIDLTFIVPEEVLAGVPFDLRVDFSNNSGAVLEDARLTLALPEGAAFFGRDPQILIDNKPLGNIGIGSLIQENYKIILFAPDGESRKFKATLNYSPASLGASFEKSREVSVKVLSSGILVEMAMPENLISGEEFEIEINYRNVSENDFSDLELKLEYPPAFTFSGSSLELSGNNNIWRLGDLRKNSEGNFSIKGSLIGSEGDMPEFNVILSTRAAGQEYTLYKSSAKTLIASSPLSIAINLNGSPDYISKAGDMLNYTISYINNTDSELRNVTVRAQLIGEMFDLNTMQTQGSFRFVDNTLIWNSANTPNLARLDPGSAGIVNFSVRTKENYPIKSFSDKNFTLQVSAEAESGSKFSKARLETKISGRLAIDTQAYFRDAKSGILNRGSMPPRADQATNFTVHWLLNNFGSDVSGVEVRAALGNNVKVVGEPKSNIGSIPVYQEESGLVVWNIDRIQANRGVVGGPIEAIFQIEATPTSDLIGSYMPLIDQTIVRALDDFTGRELIGSDVPITTALPDDLTVGQQGGVVQP
jgi:hypothetical protein